MPGKCKFQDSWLSKIIYKDWLVKDEHDIHFARCRACCKSIKLQTMGEAALTSHAGGAGHKAAVRKLMEGNLLVTNSDGQTNGSEIQDSKEHVSICFQHDPSDEITGDDCSEVDLKPIANSTSPNVEQKDVTFPDACSTAPGTTSEKEAVSHCSTQRDTNQSRLEHHRRTDALQQQQQMKVLEWENRMKVLEWEQELLKERMKAARQEEKAFRMKKAYYKAKLKRMGEGAPPSSSSSSDEEEKTSDPMG